MEEKNFSKETVMEMNLGPLHLFGPLVTEVYTRWNKTFIYALCTYVSNVKDYKLGAAFSSRRDREEQKARFPPVFWK